MEIGAPFNPFFLPHFQKTDLQRMGQGPLPLDRISTRFFAAFPAKKLKIAAMSNIGCQQRN
jgi:hypothetical protein